MDMQNVSNLTIPEGQVRTIHSKDSRLIWGRVAYNTKYAGDTSQQTYSGKNLFNSYALAGKTFAPASCQMVIGPDGTITLTGNTGSNGYCRVMNTPLRDFCPKLEVGETYYLYLVGENLARNNIYLNSSGSVWDAGTSRTITQSDLDSDIVFYGGYNTTTTIKIMVTKAQDNNYEPYVGGIPAPNPDNPQAVQTVTGEQTVTISDGANSENFAISLGSIELCKIGNYQDYIYKSGDGWYVHKEVSKQVLDGTENIYNKDTSSGFTRIFFSLTGQVNVGNNRSTNLRSDYFNASDVNNYGTAFLNNARALVYPQSTITTVEEFKTWLSSHNTTVYYPIATPTDTKITDATLVAQLNDVHEWLTRYGYNATVSGDLPIVIDRTNL